MRKPALSMITSLILLVGVGFGTQAALASHDDDPNTWCTPENAYRGHGIYRPSDGRYERFDIFTRRRTQFEYSKVLSAAFFCGTDPSPPGIPDDLVGVINVVTPGKNENIHCGNPANVGAYCADQSEPDLPDKGFVGLADVDVYCQNEFFLCGEAGQVLPHTLATSYTDYDTGRAENRNDPNRCMPWAVACAEARTVPIRDIYCYNDLITTGPVDGKFTLTIYPTNCYVFDDGRLALDYPTSILNIHGLLVCDYQGAVGGEGCGPTHQNKWVFQNGRANAQGKPWTWLVDVTMTQSGDVFTAKGKVKWTP